MFGPQAAIPKEAARRRATDLFKAASDGEWRKASDPPKRVARTECCKYNRSGSEEEHEADSGGPLLVLILTGGRIAVDLALGPPVIELSHDLERLGGLVVEPTRDQSVFGLEVDRVAVGLLQVARAIAAGDRNLAVLRAESRLPDEPVRLAGVVTPSAVVGRAADAVERGADPLAAITRGGEGEHLALIAQTTAATVTGHALAPCRCVLGALDRPAEPPLEAASRVDELSLEPRGLGELVVAHRRSFEHADRELGRLASGGRVGHLGSKVRVDVAKPDAAQGGAEAVAGRPVARGAHAEQGLVGQNVLPVEETQLAADQQLTPGAADRQVHLTHVDLGPEAVVYARGALHVWGEAEVNAEIGVTLFPFRIEHSKGRQQSDGEPRRLDRSAGRRDPAGRDRVAAALALFVIDERVHVT